MWSKNWVNLHFKKKNSVGLWRKTGPGLGPGMKAILILWNNEQFWNDMLLS